MATPLEQYEALLASGEYRADDEQRKVALALDDLYHRLLQRPSRRW